MRKSFSLIELLTTMSIIGILAAVAVIGTRSYLPNWRLSGSARLLTTKIRQAQEDAVATQLQHRILFSSTVPPITYKLVKVLDSGDEDLETVSMPVGITLQLNIANPITFGRDGAPVTSGGTIVLTSGTNSKTIEIQPAGVIRLE